MTDKTKAKSQTVDIAPMAALNLVTAERDFLRNRALLLENAVHHLTTEKANLTAEIEMLKLAAKPDKEK